MAVDESHKIKNPDAKRTQAMQRLAVGGYDTKLKGGKRERVTFGPGIGRVTLMSGTPQVNKPLELWTSVSTVAPWVPEFSTFTRFAFRYCNPQNDGHGWNFSGSSNTAELNQLLTGHCMMRRIKADVLKSLPAKTWSTIPLDFDRREYDQVEAAFNGINWQAGMETLIRFGGNPAKSDEPIVAIQKLKEIAGYAKLKSAIEWIQDYTEEGRKLVVFAHHRNVITNIQSELEKNQEYVGKVQVIMGGVSNDERDSAVQAFQNDPTVRVIIVSIQAGGFGLTLTAASAVAFVQIPWSPAELQQCADRVHRVGQTASSVQIFVLTAEGTVEDDLAEMIMSKASVMDEVLDGGRSVNYVDLGVA
jgi:SWI/SNF-related matrix-associated actin-dependent regulator 1 of chromatin subfamily A